MKPIFKDSKKKLKERKLGENVKAMLDQLPQENMVTFKSQYKKPKEPRPVSTKNRPVAKAKDRTVKL